MIFNLDTREALPFVFIRMSERLGRNKLYFCSFFKWAGIPGKFYLHITTLGHDVSLFPDHTCCLPRIHIPGCSPLTSGCLQEIAWLSNNFSYIFPSPLFPDSWCSCCLQSAVNTLFCGLLMSQISVTFHSHIKWLKTLLLLTSAIDVAMFVFVILCHSAQLTHWCQAQPSMKPLSILVLLSNHSSSTCSDAKVEMSSPVCSEGSGCIYFMKSLLTSSCFGSLWRKCRFQAEGFW